MSTVPEVRFLRLLPFPFLPFPRSLSPPPPLLTPPLPLTGHRCPSLRSPRSRPFPRDQHCRFRTLPLRRSGRRAGAGWRERRGREGGGGGEGGGVCGGGGCKSSGGVSFLLSPSPVSPILFISPSRPVLHPSPPSLSLHLANLVSYPSLPLRFLPPSPPLPPIFHRSSTSLPAERTTSAPSSRRSLRAQWRRRGGFRRSRRVVQSWYG